MRSFKGVFLLFFSVLITISLSSCRMQSPRQYHDLYQYLTAQGFVAVPLYKTKDNYYLLESTISGRRAYFLLDTGSTVTSVNKNLLDRLNLRITPRSAATIEGESGAVIQSYQIVLKKIKIGRYLSQNEIAQAAPHYIESLNIERNPIGTVGLSFLREHQAIIDYSHDLLFLWPEDRAVGVNTSSFLQDLLSQRNYAETALITSPSHHLLVPATVNNQAPVRLLLDSGSSRSILGIAFAKKYGLTLVPRESLGRGATGGVIRLYNVANILLRINTIVWHIPSMVSLDFQFVHVGIPVAGALGNDLLLSNDAVVNISGNQLFLRHN